MIRSFTAKIIALIAAAACLICLCACGEDEMPKRLDGMYSSTTSDDTAIETSSQGEQETSSADQEVSTEYTAPKFKSGNYVMESTTTQDQYIYSGKNVVAYVKLTQTYTYDIKLTVNKDSSMKAVYTFSRIQTSYEDSESETMDTNDASGNNDENKPYYDLIGQSFTVKVSKDYELSISGIDKINKKYPDTADIVGDDNMLEIAADLFYNIDSKLKIGTSWKMEQSGITNTYKVSSVTKNSFIIDIIGGKLEVPDSFTTDNGFTYNYSACEPLSGSLVMNQSNRMIQEQSSYQENNGTIEYSGTTYKFTESASSVCNISKAK